MKTDPIQSSEWRKMKLEILLYWNICSLHVVRFISTAFTASKERQFYHCQYHFSKFFFSFSPSFIHLPILTAKYNGNKKRREILNQRIINETLIDPTAQILQGKKDRGLRSIIYCFQTLSHLRSLAFVSCPNWSFPVPSFTSVSSFSGESVF